MLSRPPPPDDPAAAKRQRRAEVQRDYRKRKREHKMAVMVEIDGAVLNFLSREAKLSERDSRDRRKIGKLIAITLAALARRS